MDIRLQNQQNMLNAPMIYDENTININGYVQKKKKKAVKTVLL